MLPKFYGLSSSNGLKLLYFIPKFKKIDGETQTPWTFLVPLNFLGLPRKEAGFGVYSI